MEYWAVIQRISAVDGGAETPRFGSEALFGVVAHNGYIKLLMIGPVTFCPIAVTHCVLVAYFFLFELDIITLPIPFVYRYGILCNDYRIKQFFTCKRVTFLMTAVLVLIASFNASIEPFIRFSKTSIREGPLSDSIHLSFARNYIVVIIVYFVFLFTTTIISYIISIVIVKRIFQMLNQMNLSKRTRAMQKEMMVGMVLQVRFFFSSSSSFFFKLSLICDKTMGCFKSE
ncbi:unnamed protein product [Toxocara canis]|uniref:G_PROTEIN_RECEP_F1_2 domain-containing protein n=1 Tax=Toxocara canis TaxID=6265 RepID=A0A183V1Y3_TOXCA|nr:unnamed protein product [Toxocara canis]